MIIKQHLNQIYSLSLPKSWDYEESDGIDTFYKPGSMGAIHISIFKKDKPSKVQFSDALPFFKRYVTNKKFNIETINIYVDNKDIIFRVTYFEKDIFWEARQILNNKRRAFITYNCKTSFKNSGNKDREIILNSFKWKAG